MPPPPRAIMPAEPDPLPRIARTGPSRLAQGDPARHEPARPLREHVDSVSPLSRRRSVARRVLWVTVATAVAISGGILLGQHVPVDALAQHLIAEIATRTGRTPTVGGRPSLTLWPHVAVSFPDVVLPNPKGMDGPPLAAVSRLDATLRLWPLLSGRVQLGQLVLQRADIHLQTDASGRRNWDFAEASPGPTVVRLAKTGPSQGASQVSDLPEELRAFAKGASDTRRDAGATNSGIESIRIVDGRLRQISADGAIAADVGAIDMTLAVIGAAEPVHASGTFTWRGETLRLDTRVMPMQALASGAPAQTVASLSSDAGQLTFNGTLTGGAQARADGLISLKAGSASGAARWLGQSFVADLPSGPLSIKGRMSGTTSKGSISEAVLVAPGVNMSGALAFDLTGARPKLTGAMRLSDLKLDSVTAVVRRGLQTASATATTAGPRSIEDLLRTDSPAIAKPATPKPQVRGYLSRDGWDENPLDLTALDVLDADLRLGFGRLSAQSLSTGPGQLHLTVAGHSTRLVVDELALHEGKLRGAFAFDGSQARPTATLSLTMDGVALGPLLRELGMQSGRDTEPGLDGRAKIVVSLNGRGKTERQMVDSLAGRVEIAIPKGTISGFDLGARLSDTMPVLGGGAASREGAGRLAFTDLGASFTIAKGVADNRDFRVVTPEARAIGQGQIALGPRTLDFGIRAKLSVGGAAGIAGISGGIDVPLRVSGPWSHPVVALDAGVAAATDTPTDGAAQPQRSEPDAPAVAPALLEDATRAKARDAVNRLLGR